jgi:hypothetical protein
MARTNKPVSASKGSLNEEKDGPFLKLSTAYFKADDRSIRLGAAQLFGCIYRPTK